MTSNDTKRESGYRGALPTRQDRLARPWILTVATIFVLILVLSVAGIPSRFIPEPTAVPLPSTTATPVSSASASPSPAASGSGAASAAASASASPTAGATP
jgi:hypothetical protein